MVAMRYILPILAALSMSVASIADSKDKQIKCAVQGFSISIAQATKDHMFADYKGRRYFFCCNGCPQEFKSNPAKYAKTAPSIPTPKSTKKKSTQ